MKNWRPILLLFAAAAAPCTLAQNWPIKVSPNGRYFVDSTGAPWIMVGDNSGYNLMNYLPLIGTQSVDTYLADREAHGFNTVWMNVVFGVGSQTPASAELYDGTRPFTSPANGIDQTYDFSTPNSAYWAEIDALVARAAAHNLVIAMIPFETGLSNPSWPPPQSCTGGQPNGTGWLTAARAQGATAMYNYGVFLGNRYKNSPNVMWVLGYDFQSQVCQGVSGSPGANDAGLVAELLAGIESVDPNHIVTGELSFLFSYDTENATLAPLMKANGVYSYGGIYDEMLQAYNNKAIPAFLIEGNWEFGNNKGILAPWPVSDNNLPCGTSAPPCSTMGNPTYSLVERMQWWWTMTSGGAGFFYGNPYGSKASGDMAGSWWPGAGIDTVAIAQLGYATNFFAGILWQSMVPDQSHQVVTEGYGTYCGSTSSCLNQLSNDYVTTTWNPNGTLAVIYNPQGNTLTVNLAKLAGPVTAYWYDPTKGTYATISGSPFTNSGSYSFVTHSTNSTGSKDWVLVLTAPVTNLHNPNGPDPQ
jgi:hypothetical protein